MRYWFCLLACGIFSAALSQKDVAWDLKTDLEISRQVEKSIGLIKQPRAEQLVKAVGSRLVSQLPSSTPYTFYFQIVDQEEPNAFALPGGHVYISRGLLAMVSTEDELAGVLGHEIIHVVQRHSAKQQRKVLPTILATPGVILGSTLGGSLGEKVAAPLLGAGQVILSSHSRKQESEADAMGIALAAKAGYDPARLSDILHRIEQWVESESGKKARFSLLNDHPLTPERMGEISRRSKELGVSNVEHIYKPLGFLQSLDSLLYGPNPVKGIFIQNTFYHPDLKIYWKLPSGWNYLNESTAAGAVKDKRQMLLTISGKERQLETLIENFVNGYYSKTRHKPISDKKVNMQGREGAEVIITGSDRKNLVYTLWFKKGGFTWVILAIGEDDSLIDDYRTSALSFRDLKKEDYDDIFRMQVMGIAAREGETLSALSNRSANVAGNATTAILNGLDPSYVCRKGDRIKVILRTPYKP